MWPMLFGSEWIWGALIGGTLICFIVGVLGFLVVVTAKPPQRTSDELGETWHPYEGGHDAF